MVYGPEGETPISDEELGDYLAQEMVQLAYVVILLYNSQNFALASDDEKAEMKKKAQAIVNQVYGPDRRTDPGTGFPLHHRRQR